MKSNILYFCAGAILCFFLLTKCDGCLSSTDISSKIDTVYVKTMDSGSYVPKVDFIKGGNILAGDSVTEKRARLSGTDTFWIYEKVWQPVDTMAILQDHFSKVHYSDTQSVKYGKLYIYDTVSRNRITGRSFRLEQDIPYITAYHLVKEPKKIKGYLTGTIQGTIADPLQAAGPGFMLQFKNDHAVEMSRLFGRTVSRYQLSYKFKLSFTKK